MFDIGFLELVVLLLIGLIVLGPERLPYAIKFVNHWITKIKSNFLQIKYEVDNELKMKEFHDLKGSISKIKDDLQQEVNEVKNQVNDTTANINDEEIKTSMSFNPLKDTEQNSTETENKLSNTQNELPPTTENLDNKTDSKLEKK